MSGHEDAEEPVANSINPQEASVSNPEGADVDGGSNEDGEGNNADSDDYYEVERILDEEVDEEDGELYYFVRWKGYSPSNDSREPAQELAHCTDILAAWEMEKAARPAGRPPASNTLHLYCVRAHRRKKNGRIVPGPCTVMTPMSAPSEATRGRRKSESQRKAQSETMRTLLMMGRTAKRRRILYWPNSRRKMKEPTNGKTSIHKSHQLHRTQKKGHYSQLRSVNDDDGNQKGMLPVRLREDLAVLFQLRLYKNRQSYNPLKPKTPLSCLRGW